MLQGPSCNKSTLFLPLYQMLLSNRRCGLIQVSRATSSEVPHEVLQPLLSERVQRRGRQRPQSSQLSRRRPGEQRRQAGPIHGHGCCDCGCNTPSTVGPVIYKIIYHYHRSTRVFCAQFVFTYTYSRKFTGESYKLL